MGHHRDADVDEPVHEIELGPLQLHRLSAALLDHAPGVADAVLDRGLERHERHVADDHRTLDASRDGPHVVQHLLHRDGQLVRVAEDVASDRVADEQHGHARAIQDLGGGEVVGGQHHEAPALGLPRSKVVDGYRHRSRLLECTTCWYEECTPGTRLTRCRVGPGC